MKDIYIRQFEFEKCTANKRKYDTIMPYTAIHYVTDGYGYFDGIRIGKGEYFCTFENKKSVWYPDRENPWSYYFADICGDDTCRILKKYEFDESKSHGYFDSYEELELLYKLFCLKKTKDAINKDFSVSVARTLLSLHDTGVHSKKITESEKLVNEVKNYIDHNYHRKIKVEDIASDLFLSRGYIRNVFYEKTGMSPKAYLQNVRFDAACSLLKNTAYSVAEISRSVGYDDQLNFSKLFHKKYGISPLGYRKEG